MVGTKAEVRLRASEAATLPISVTIDATGGIVEGGPSWLREKGGGGISFERIQDVPSGGTPAQFV